MNWQTIRLIMLALLAAFLVIFIGGVGIANNESDITIFKMGTDVIVPAKQVMTDAVAIDGNVTILDEGQVINDAVAIGGDIILKPNASVGGDAVAIGGQIFKEEGAIVGGSEIAMFSNAKVLFDRFGLLGTLYLTNVLFWLISLTVVLILGIFLLLLLPDPIQTITATLGEYPFKSAMWGLIGIVAINLFTALFSGSVFGFLLIPIVNLALVVAGMIGTIATSSWIGKKILPHKEAPFIPFFLGMLILAIISFIPLVGGLIILMLNMFGFGAVLLSRVGTVQLTITQKPLDELKGTA